MKQAFHLEMASNAEPRCGLYIHVPFCETKCGYCDFYSVPLKGRDAGPLVSALIVEMERRLCAVTPTIRTIFCGGGTPTLLPINDLARLLGTIKAQVSLTAVEEFTVEANPATVDDEKAKLLASSEVSRVSMGAQSFFPAELATLERLHSPEDIAPSVATLRRHGIGQINLDLIFGVPGQTLTTWSESLRRAIELEPNHIACYGLTYEPATRLTALRDAGRIHSCDENLETDMYLHAIDVLAAAGYRQYEISNFAKPGCECRHNLIYWRNEPYIGIGPSAAGFLLGELAATNEDQFTDPAAGRPTSIELPIVDGQPALGSRGPVEPKAPMALGTSTCSGILPRMDEGPVDEKRVGKVVGRRYKNVADVAAYVRGIRERGHAENESEWIDREKLILEMILMQLRLNEGLYLDIFRSRIGLELFDLFGDALTALFSDGFLATSDGRLFFTRRGRLLANAVMKELAGALEFRSLSTAGV